MSVSKLANVSASKLAKRWKKKNTWFGLHHALTAIALGVHEELLELGIEADTPLYYSLVNLAMQGWLAK